MARSTIELDGMDACLVFREGSPMPEFLMPKGDPDKPVPDNVLTAACCLLFLDNEAMFNAVLAQMSSEVEDANATTGRH